MLKFKMEIGCVLVFKIEKRKQRENRILVLN